MKDRTRIGMSWPVLLFVLVGMPGTLAGCSSSQSGELCGGKIGNDIWTRHAEVMGRALDESNPRTSEGELEAALEFFADLTGIEMRVNLSTLGALVVQDTASDFERVQEWRKLHCEEIYYDEGASKLRVRSRSKG